MNRGAPIGHRRSGPCVFDAVSKAVTAVRVGGRATRVEVRSARGGLVSGHTGFHGGAGPCSDRISRVTRRHPTYRTWNPIVVRSRPRARKKDWGSSAIPANGITVATGPGVVPGVIRAVSVVGRSHGVAADGRTFSSQEPPPCRHRVGGVDVDEGVEDFSPASAIGSAGVDFVGFGYRSGPAVKCPLRTDVSM